jgi:dihydroneopterin aldolase
MTDPTPGPTLPATYELQVIGIEFWGRHGVFEDERLEGRHYQVDLYVDVERRGRLAEDDLSGTLDYRRLADLVVEIGLGPSVRLIETLADRIATRCFDLDGVVRAKVTVRKRASAVPGNPKWVAVKIRRSRAGIPADPGDPAG